MSRTIHELINNKLQEAGITVPDRPVSVTQDCYGERCNQLLVPGAVVTVGEFTVIGIAYLSEDLAKQVRPFLTALSTPPPVWTPHCLKGDKDA